MKIPYTIIDGIEIAKTNGFRTLEMIGSFEMAKFWISKSKTDIATIYLENCLEQMLLNLDLMLQRNGF
jgi:hypothetical protein